MRGVGSGRKDRRSQSMGIAYVDLPIILEESLDDQENEECEPSTSKRQYVLRSVSEQHPSSKHGRDVLAMVSKTVCSTSESVCPVGGACEEAPSNSNCFPSSQTEDKKEAGHLLNSPAGRWYSSTRVVYYRK